MKPAPGALTLALLILPTVIRSSGGARVGSEGLQRGCSGVGGGGQWRTILTVLLPAALPGILTGIVISMGRAAERSRSDHLHGGGQRGAVDPPDQAAEPADARALVEPLQHLHRA